MSTQRRSLPKSVWWSAASLVLMIVGALGPWATVADLVTMSGTDGGRDGWVVVGAAGVATLGVLLYLRFRRRWLLVFPLLSGLIAVATTAYDISDVRDLAGSNEIFGELVSTEWGIYVAFAGSVSLTLASIALVIESRRTKPVAIETPVAA